MTLWSAAPGLPQTERVIVGSTATTILTGPANGGLTVQSLYIHEATNNATDLTVEVFDGTTAYRLMSTESIAGKARIKLDVEQHLKEGDVLRATASVAARIHLHASYALPT